MSKFTKKKALLFLTLALIFFIILLHQSRATVLSKLGLLLLEADTPVKSDVIVALRGDWHYSRILKADYLFKQRIGNYIYIATALNDRNSSKLEKIGVKINSERERLQDILQQLNIPTHQIIIDKQQPGGGTVGEVKRIKTMMLQHKFNSALIVTSWWHTKRTKKICQRTFGDTDMIIRVVSAEESDAALNQWWQHRYEALRILEEFPKLILYYFFSSNLSFADDPIDKKRSHQSLNPT